MSADIMNLPQKGSWHCYVHKLRAWIRDDDGLPVRPYLMLVVSTEDGKFLSCEPGDTAETALGGNIAKVEPSSETVLHFLKRVMTHPTQMNSNAAGEKLAPSRPKTIKFADTKAAALHLGEKEKWAEETACPYVQGAKRARGAGRRGVPAPVPPCSWRTSSAEASSRMAPENQNTARSTCPA